MSWNYWSQISLLLTLKSRSTWACELKLKSILTAVKYSCHAPRERVSWNKIICENLHFPVVTLHVSVWVEISNVKSCLQQYKSRSTWACELKCLLVISTSCKPTVTLHVSVWVEIGRHCLALLSILSRSTWACELKFISLLPFNGSIVSRSTWACELKFFNEKEWEKDGKSHAPRERVSWNFRQAV